MKSRPPVPNLDPRELIVVEGRLVVLVPGVLSAISFSLAFKRSKSLLERDVEDEVGGAFDIIFKY